MRARSGFFVFACVALGAAAHAQDEALDGCLTLSFAPLDMNVPSCTALLENADSMDPETLGAVLAARAEAYEFALTYRSGHDVDDRELLDAALADLERAAAADPAHNMRLGDVLFQLGRFTESAQSYTAALAAENTIAPWLLESRSSALAEAGDMAGALADMSAAIRVATSPPDVNRLTVRRAELYEAAGDWDAARADYEAVLARDPNHASAKAGANRLAADSDD